MASGSRKAEAEITGNTRPLERSLGRAETSLRKFAGTVRRDIGGSIRGAFEGLKDIAGFGGLFGLGLAARDALAFEKRLVRLGIASDKNAVAMARMKQQIVAISKAEGVDAAQVLGGFEQFVALTGDADAAAANMTTFGRVASATGSSLEEVAVAGASIQQQFGLSASEMERAFDILIDGGKRGSIEMKDFASLVAGVAPGFKQFGKGGAEGIAEMSTLMQAMRVNYKGAAETATGFNSLVGVLLKQQARLKKAGAKIEIFDPKTGKRRMKPMLDVIFEVDKAAEKLAKRGRMSKEAALFQLVGDKEATSAILAVIAKGREEMDKTVAASLQAAHVEKDRATYLESNASKMERAQVALKQSLNETVAKHADSIAKAMAAIAKAVEFIVQNPLTALAGVMAMKLGPGTIAAVLADMGAGGAAGRGGAGGKGGGREAGGGKLAKTGRALASLPFIAEAAAVGGVVGGVIHEQYGDKISDTLFGDVDRREKASSFVLEAQRAGSYENLSPAGKKAFDEYEMRAAPGKWLRRQAEAAAAKYHEEQALASYADSYLQGGAGAMPAGVAPTELTRRGQPVAAQAGPRVTVANQSGVQLEVTARITGTAEDNRGLRTTP